MTALLSHTVGSREIWVQPSITGRATQCFTFLDAELYRERVHAPDIVARLQQEGDLPPTTFLYLSSGTPSARHHDFTCNDQYSSFLVDDLVPWIERTQGGFEQHFLGGLSLSGLAVAFAVLQYPAVFAGGLCQSPSAWWNGEWLTSTIQQRMSSQSRFWISVGNEELQADVSHPPTNMFQGVCQLTTVRRLIEQMNEINLNVRAHEFCGGHDPKCWAEELPSALRWLLKGDC